MRIRFGGRCLAAFSCVLIMAGAQAASPDSAAGQQSLRDIAIRIDAAIAARSAGRAEPAAASDVAQRARGELDALANAAARHGFADDASFARKLAQVRRLESILERAAAAPRDASIPTPATTPDPRRTMRATANAHGASCADAIAVAPGDAVDAWIANGASLWLRVAPQDARFARLDTLATPLDTEITLFGAACPAGDGEAVARNDDAYGLAAALAIDTGHTPGVRYARVRNLGRAGRVIAQLEGTGAFVGQITDERTGHGLGADVITMSADGYFGVGTSSNDSTGFYLLTTDAGSFYVVASSFYTPTGPYVPELYPNAPCFDFYDGLSGCDATNATLFALQAGQQIAGVNIALNVGGRITGTVRDAMGAPLPFATVQLYGTDGNVLSYGQPTDVAGRYAIAGLATGTVYAVAFNVGYSGQVYDHVSCDGPTQYDCHPLEGTPIAIVRDQQTPGIDFALSRQARVHATATTRDGSALPNSWTISVLDSEGHWYSGYGNFGEPIDTDGLPPGTYRAFAYADGFFSQLWQNVDCPSDCTQMLDSGTPFTVPEGGVANLVFSLLPLPAVSGTITDATTHAPIVGAEVTLIPLDSGIGYAYSSPTDSSGHYEVRTAVPGSYYALASANLYLEMLYPNVPCPPGYPPQCDDTLATPVTTQYGGGNIANIDFALPVNGTITGRLSLRVPDGMIAPPPVSNYEFIAMYALDGTFMGGSSVFADGTYEVYDLPAGTYYAIARGDAFDQAYGGVDCADQCAPTDSAPITLAQSATTSNIDFDPYPRNWIFGRVTEAGGAPVANVAIDLWSDTDELHCGAAATDAAGWYAITETTGCSTMHRLSTDVPLPYVNQVYDGLVCPNGSAWLGLCSLDGGTVVPYPSTPSFRIANFNLGPRRDPIFADGFER
ncbi:MAG: carboxypeptidase-like regulatory domain-containing protein [Rhodanobacteraceae bacterium]